MAADQTAHQKAHQTAHQTAEPADAQPDAQWVVVLDADGELVADGTVVADDLPDGWSSRSTAAGVSILAMTSGPRGWGSVPTRRTSWAERTNDTATMSTPSRPTKPISGCRMSRA